MTRINNPFTTNSEIIITCNRRLAPYLEKEILQLGFNVIESFSGGVKTNGTLADCIALNLNLRCASQVLYLLKTFQAKHPNEVYKQTANIAWEDLFETNRTLAITSSVKHETVNNRLFMNLKVKDAIVDRMRATRGERPNSGSDLNECVVHLHWHDEIAELFIDSSGETLAKHAYRKMPGRAPMLESLVAATLMATKWDKDSTFINPMCGSGTIAIEAALWATQRKPGLLRKNYGFMHWKGYEASVYKAELKKLQNQVNDIDSFRIIANDNNREVLNAAKTNAQAAGVDQYIDFVFGDFEEIQVPPPIEGQNPVIFFNPEYGERLGDIQQLEATYKRIGDFMKKRCKGYWGYIFTGNLDLAKKVGLSAKPRIEFYSAKLDCRLLQYALYEGSRKKES